MCAARSSSPRSVILGSPNSRSSLCQLASKNGCLADQKLRHVVQPQLVEVVPAHHHQDVGLGAGERLPVPARPCPPTPRRTAAGLQPVAVRPCRDKGWRVEAMKMAAISATDFSVRIGGREGG